MIEIDGIYGEGGGQILRYSVALSVLTKKSIRIVNIRANRQNPGLRPQHFTAVRCLKKICNAKTKGLEIGSLDLEFEPKDVKTGIYEFDIGTAGSIPLVFQCLILALSNINKKTEIKIIGGTDVKWAPSWDYFAFVFLKLLKKMNFQVNAKLIKRGYYPKGGGEASIKIFSNQKLKSLNVKNKQRFDRINGIVNIANLPDNISRRIKHSTIEECIKNDLNCFINIDKKESLSPGCGLTLWTESKDSVLGTSLIGEKGLPSEKIGKISSKNLIEQIKSNATLDIFALDQIMPYLLLSDYSSSLSVKKLSNHSLTNIWLINKFVDRETNIVNKNGLVQFTVK